MIFNLLSFVVYISGFVAIVLIVIFILENIKYKRITKLDVYLNENPNCKRHDGVQCKYCGSKSIGSFSKKYLNSKFRFHICNVCEEILYRSEVAF